MAYTGIQTFMEKLNQIIINSNDIPSLKNPAIVRERPQLQLLYKELDNMIQTLFIHQHHDLLEKQLNDLKRRFIDAAEEAEYRVDQFLSDVRSQFPTFTSWDFNPSLTQFCLGGNWKEEKRKGVEFRAKFNPSKLKANGEKRKEEKRKERKGTEMKPCSSVPSLNETWKHSVNLDLDGVMRSFKDMEMEFISMGIDSIKMDPPHNQSVAAQSSVSRGSNKVVMNEIVVGLDGDAELIRDNLVEDQKKLTVVSIVGMGGIGKTTLATKVFNDRYIKHHFYVRVWVTVSQTYDKRAVLTQILESILDGQLDLEKANDSRLRELVHKNLMDKRYLIVLDDIWHIETWDNLKVFFTRDNNNGSRILLTSRLTEVAKHASSDGLVHHLEYLNKERSWELLCQKVFQGKKCPEWSNKPGMQIVENCRGLPLAVVVIAGVLAKRGWSKQFWEKIAEKTGSFIVGDQNGCLETLALSYNHLPLHLRECFLYFGGFPEDYEFKVQRLIWLWVAEGFIQQDGYRSLEDIAEGYLMDLIDKNLIIVAHRSKFNGGVKACKVHDLVRELCIRKAKEERFMLTDIERLKLSAQLSTVIRMFIKEDINTLGVPYSPTQNLRSIQCFSELICLSDETANGLCSFVLLRVLDLRKCMLNDIPKGMELLVHLRYLAIWVDSSQGFPSSIRSLWNLQTLIYITEQPDRIDLPTNISDLINLKHLWCYQRSTWERIPLPLFLPSIEKPMNLQTISGVMLGDGVDNFQKCFPYVKELTCVTQPRKENDFKSLSYLEKLKFLGYGKGCVTFPVTLKSLTLQWCRLGWSEMSIIQGLPNLQILKLHDEAFEGSCWNTDGQEFPRLRFLRLRSLNIERWEASFPSFPCLEQLEIFNCKDLKEIPPEIGYIPTLELINLKSCSESVDESVKSIQEEQRDLGNDNLKIDCLQFWSEMEECLRTVELIYQNGGNSV